MKKILSSVVALLAMSMAMVSCGDDNFADPTYTDVSDKAVGVYVGELSTQDASAPLVGDNLKVTITHNVDEPGVNTVTLEGTVTNSSNSKSYTINDTRTMNAILANGSYVLTNPLNSLTFGKITGNTIEYTVKMTPAGKLNAVGKFYTVRAEKISNGE